MSLSCTFLANCGLLLHNDDSSILIDSPSGLHTKFDGTSEAEFEQMLAHAAPYDGLCGLFFTHTHADHFDRKRVQMLLSSDHKLKVYIPSCASLPRETIAAGDFTVEIFKAPHSGAEFADTVHRTLLIEVAGHRLYVTGDADWVCPVHQEVIDTYKPDIGIWNPNFVSHQEGRALLREIPQNFINHMPVQADDYFGIGKKCQSSFKRYAETLKNTVLIDDYPMSRDI